MGAFVTEWVTSSNGETITLPLTAGYTYNCTVDWGDSGPTSTITAYNDADRIHTYSSAGTYQVSITGTCEGWSFNNGGDKLKITKVISWGTGASFNGFKYLKSGFYGCVSLTSLPTDGTKILASGDGVTTDGFYQLFRSCSNIEEIPSSIFDNHVKVESFERCFILCTRLATIPDGLFGYNTAVINFEDCFWGCSSLNNIPSNLFSENVEVTNFSGCFSDCGSLAAIPDDLFTSNIEVTSFRECFYGCTSIVAIPEDLFAFNTKVTSFRECFYNCASITAISDGLFEHNEDVTDFNSCFYGCSLLTTAPNSLFATNVDVTDFSYCFSGCYSLQQNPWTFYTDGQQATRFNGKIVDFTGCFERSAFAGSQGTAPDLWECDFGSGSATKTNCWYGSGNSLTSLTNYYSIPDEWIENNYRSVIDSIATNDSVEVTEWETNSYREVTDSLAAISDLVEIEIGKEYSDSLAISDSLEAVGNFYKSISASLSTEDSLGINLEFSREVRDVLFIGDSVQLELERNNSDGIILIDSVETEISKELMIVYQQRIP
jgi:hypothetical protein